MDESNDAFDDLSLRARIMLALPYLLLATNIVLAAVVISRPWEETLPTGAGATGVIAQVPHAKDVNVETLARPDHLAPNFRLESLTGELVELAGLRGRPVVLNFWATWCFTCVTEMPAIERATAAFGEDVAVIGVNVGEDADRARAFAKTNEIKYTLLLDPSQRVTKEYLVHAMPTTLFIRDDGVISDARYGPISEAEIAALIAPLMEPAGNPE